MSDRQPNDLSTIEIGSTKSIATWILYSIAHRPSAQKWKRHPQVVSHQPHGYVPSQPATWVITPAYMPPMPELRMICWVGRGGPAYREVQTFLLKWLNFTFTPMWYPPSWACDDPVLLILSSAVACHHHGHTTSMPGDRREYRIGEKVAARIGHPRCKSNNTWHQDAN